MKSNESNETKWMNQVGGSKSVKSGNETADEAESSSNEHSHRLSRTNGKTSAPALLLKRSVDDDLDSGIALNATLRDSSRRNKYLEKKSIFTIAYDEMATKKIPSASDHQPSWMAQLQHNRLYFIILKTNTMDIFSLPVAFIQIS